MKMLDVFYSICLYFRGVDTWNDVVFRKIHSEYHKKEFVRGYITL